MKLMELHPAYLWIGSPDHLKKVASNFVKQVLCKNHACNSCIECTKIDKQQHHLVCWLEPENQYTVAQLEIIFKTIAFCLDPGQHFFFILQRADLLTITCANSLLKSLEEPPQGYHFILLCPKQDAILPTISSRCIIQEFKDTATKTEHPLFPYFTYRDSSNLSEFAKELENSKIAERDMLDFIDTLYIYWVKIFEDAYNQGNVVNLQKSKSILEILNHSCQYPPMPGSSKIFLRNLFLQVLVQK